MTSEELIEKEANERYPNRPVVLGRGNTCLSCGEVQRDAFKAGVEWHKNHLWHTNEEQPINGKEALIEYGNDWHDVGFYYTDSDSFQIGIEDYVERSLVARWAYLEDLESL